MAEEKPVIASEMSKMAVEPMLAIEKKLVGYSLLLGALLLAALAITSTYFFRA
ncbi:MAG TPA: hypothetical protein VGP72_02475 [Planctomycetota bacterium]